MQPSLKMCALVRKNRAVHKLNFIHPNPVGSCRDGSFKGSAPSAFNWFNIRR